METPAVVDGARLTHSPGRAWHATGGVQAQLLMNELPCVDLVNDSCYLIAWQWPSSANCTSWVGFG